MCEQKPNTTANQTACGSELHNSMEGKQMKKAIMTSEFKGDIPYSSIMSAIERVIDKRRSRGATDADILKYLDHLKVVWKSETINRFLDTLAVRLINH
jgi:hypothetical protein